MSWLSDLKEEAEAVRRRESQATESACATVEAVQPQLRMVRNFLGELSEQLNVLGPGLSHAYDLLGHARLAGLKQENHFVEVEEAEGLIRRVRLRYECFGGRPVQFWVENHEECNAIKERLYACSMQFRFKDDDHWRYVFTVQPLVKVQFDFEPHPTESVVRLVAKNFEQLGENMFSLSSDKLDEGLLEEFGKKVLKQPNQFEALSGYRVDQDVRKQMQEKIAARHKERAAELGQGPRAKKPRALSRLFKKDDSPVPAAPPPAASPQPKKPAPAATKASPAPHKKYAWMITGTAAGEDTSELVSRLGPGVEYHAGIKNLVSKGAHFRMLDGGGSVQFTGYIVGECTGREPLEEYGKERGCRVIQYERNGKWEKR